jgi:membrane protease YdiL (CAAX protease family)
MVKASKSIKKANNYKTVVSKRLNQFVNSFKANFEGLYTFTWIGIAVAASQVTLLAKAQVGVYITALSLAALVGLALWKEKTRQLAISAAIIPLATMITLSLPQSTYFAQLVVFYDALLILGLIYRFIFTIDFPVKNTQLKLNGYGLALPLMIVVGEVLGGISYLLLKHHYAFSHSHVSLPLVAAASAVFAITEEIVFRGLIQQRAMQVMNTKLAAILPVILYTVMTWGHSGSWLTPLFGLIASSVLCFSYYKRQNLMLTMTANMLSKLTYIGLMTAFVLH